MHLLRLCNFPILRKGNTLKMTPLYIQKDLSNFFKDIGRVVSSCSHGQNIHEG
jgi:hypothetical protein